MLTPLKVSMKKFLKRTFKETNKKVIKHPILFASGFAYIKNSIADYTIQNVQNIKSEKPKPFNIKRNLTFALFGLLHVGAGQYIILNKIIPRIIPALNKFPISSKASLKAILIDQFVHVPLIYFPIFYTFKEIGESELKSSSKSSQLYINYHNFYLSKDNINNIVSNYKSNFKNDMIISACIFMPIQFINFKYIPPHCRVPILSSCGFLYAMLLSYLRL
tara:strand:+ start:504 stop:1160 length:657 start_codon:yes stop_codon:yes gene_type:complete